MTACDFVTVLHREFETGYQHLQSSIHNFGLPALRHKYVQKKMKKTIRRRAIPAKQARTGSILSMPFYSLVLLTDTPLPPLTLGHFVHLLHGPAQKSTRLVKCVVLRDGKEIRHEPGIGWWKQVLTMPESILVESRTSFPILSVILWAKDRRVSWLHVMNQKQISRSITPV